MSVYLEAVEQAREHRDRSHTTERQAQAAFVNALTVAAQHHSLRAVAKAAGISHSGVKYLIEQKEANDVPA